MSGKSLRAFIVEDERHGLEYLKGTLGLVAPDVAIVGSANSVASAVSQLRETEIDLLFLDIELPDGRGFQILEVLAPLAFEVVFVTAYNEFALDAFRFSAVDYLLKPVEPGELKRAVDRVAERKSRVELQDQLDLLNETLQKGTVEKVMLTSNNGFEIIEVKNITYCQAERNYTTVYFQDGSKFLASKNLKEFEQMFRDKGFFRPHQSYLINMSFVRRFNANQLRQIELMDGTAISLARSRKQEFINLLKEGKF